MSFIMGAFLDPQHTHPGISHWSRPPGLQGNNDQFSLLVSSDVLRVGVGGGKMGRGGCRIRVLPAGND